MSLPPLTIAAWLLVAAQGNPPTATDSARAVVREAILAVEGDSAAAVRARWEGRLRAAPTDRAAALGLATLARQSYDYDDAERRYRALETGAGTPDAYSIYAQIGRGWAASDRGLGPQAAGTFEQALAEARRRGDVAAEVEAMIGLGFVRRTTIGFPAALATLDSAGARVLPDAADLAALLHVRRGVVRCVLGDHRESAEEIAAASALARQAGIVRLEGWAARAAGQCLKLRAQNDSAIVALRRAVALQRRAHDRSGLAETLVRLFDASRARGDLATARQVIAEAAVEAEASRNLLILGGARVGNAALALQLDDYETAAANLAKADTVFTANADTANLMGVRGFRADLALATGDLPRARALSLDFLAWGQRIEDATVEFEMRKQLAWIAMHEGRVDEAQREIDQGLKLARREGLSEWVDALDMERGQVALARGDLTDAERFFRAYIDAAPDDSADYLPQFLGRTQLALVHARAGALDRAEQELAGAGDRLDAWRASLSDEQLRLMAFQANPRDHGDVSASTASVLAALAAGGRAEGAFQLAERRRARELTDRLIRAAALRLPDAPESQIVPVAVPVTAPRPVARVASGDDVAAALPDDSTALLEYVTGTRGAPTSLFVVTRRGVRAHVLAPADSLASNVGRFVALLEGRNDPRGLASTLGAALLAPAVAELPATVTRLVVVPDGPLHRVPFDALRLGDGRYAVERFAIAAAPSAAVAVTLWERARGEWTARAGPARLLAFGDPAYARESAAATGVGPGRASGETYRSAFDAAGGLPRLTESGREAREVARYAADPVVRLGKDASAAYLKSAPLDSFQILHFATHALVDERTVANTALALAPGGGEDGFVVPGDLAALKLAADLVVLSGCRTAGGVVLGGEGVQGLTGPFIEAGARAVVATGWRIEDRRTVDFVEHLYDALARGLPVAEALRAAKLDAMRRGMPPGEWAAFGVVGDPLVRVTLREPPPPIPSRWLVGFGALALALGGGLWLRRRKDRGVRGDE